MTRESQTSLSSPSCIPSPPQSSPIDAGYSQYRAGEGAVSFQRRLAGKRLLRAADRYAYRLWKHCLFFRDCLERRDIYILLAFALLCWRRPVDHAQLVRLTPERGLFATETLPSHSLDCRVFVLKDPGVNYLLNFLMVVWIIRVKSIKMSGRPP
jgi:hypothetical protein